MDQRLVISSLRLRQLRYPFQHIGAPPAAAVNATVTWIRERRAAVGYGLLAVGSRRAVSRVRSRQDRGIFDTVFYLVLF